MRGQTKSAAFAACVLTLFLCWPQLSVGQSDVAAPATQTLADLEAQLNLNDKQAERLRPLLEKQLEKLRKLLARYVGTGVEEARPLWRELRSSRREFELRLAELLTAEQLQVALTARSRWEEDMLRKVRAGQVRLLEERLALTAEQSNRIHSIMMEDFAKRSALLKQHERQNDFSSDAFSQELASIQRETLSHLDSILTPEQRRKLYSLEEETKRSSFSLWGTVPSVGDNPQHTALNQEKPAEQSSPTEKKRKRGEFIIAPIPMINPTLENGLAFVAAYMYRLNKNDKVSPPSLTGIGGFRTSNGSRGWGLAQQFYLKEDRYRLTFAGGRANINYNFFGIGQESGGAGISIPLNLSGSGFLIEGLRRIGTSRWYVGARYHLLKAKVAVDLGNILPTGQNAPIDRPVRIPEIDINIRTAAAGPHLLRDTRSDSFYPTRGSLFDVRMDFYGHAVGGKRTYQGYQISYNKYHSLSARQVIAARAASCFVRGDAPFYDLCAFGKSSDVRGYEAGRYLDRNLLAGQAEYRLELPKRFGFAAFGGVGEVVKKFSDFRSDKLLPGGGVGLRFRLSKESHINLRVDYAWGKDSRTLYVGVSEAF
jgi:Omp85 superfamily domain